MAEGIRPRQCVIPRAVQLKLRGKSQILRQNLQSIEYHSMGLQPKNGLQLSPFFVKKQ